MVMTRRRKPEHTFTYVRISDDEGQGSAIMCRQPDWHLKETTYVEGHGIKPPIVFIQPRI